MLPPSEHISDAQISPNLSGIRVQNIADISDSGLWVNLSAGSTIETY